MPAPHRKKRENENFYKMRYFFHIILLRKEKQRIYKNIFDPGYNMKNMNAICWSSDRAIDFYYSWETQGDP